MSLIARVKTLNEWRPPDSAKKLHKITLSGRDRGRAELDDPDEGGHVEGKELIYMDSAITRQDHRTFPRCRHVSLGPSPATKGSCPGVTSHARGRASTSRRPTPSALGGDEIRGTIDFCREIGHGQVETGSTSTKATWACPGVLPDLDGFDHENGSFLPLNFRGFGFSPVEVADLRAVVLVSALAFSPTRLIPFV